MNGNSEWVESMKKKHLKDERRKRMNEWKKRMRWVKSMKCKRTEERKDGTKEKVNSK